MELAWFRDGTRLLASGPAGLDERIGSWIVSPLTGSVRKLLDDASRAFPSPDGSHIAFVRAAETEVWVAGSGGENPRRIAGPEPGTRFNEIDWTPDGHRVAWLKLREGEDPAFQTCDRDGSPPATIFSDSRLRLFRCTPRGSVILSMAEPPPDATSHNLWELHADSRWQRARGRPRRLTNWAGTAFLHLSISADGERLAFGRTKVVADVYIADLNRNGDGFTNRRRFTTADRTSWPSAWTEDGRAVIFHSDRNGNFDIYRQGLSSASPDVLVSGRGEHFQGQISPDRASLLYLEWDPDRRDTGRLMRASWSGDPPQPLLALSGRPIAPQREYVIRGRLHTNVYPSFRCPSVPAGKCVVGEVQQGQVVFTAFDAATGARREIVKTGTDPRATFWDLSSDGARIAFGKQGRSLGKGGFLRIISTVDGSAVELPQYQAQWDSAGWAADGKSLFVTPNFSTGSRIVHLNLDGKASELYRTIGWVDRPVASPDGRRLAFSEITYDSNVWMLEHFR